MTLRLAQFHRLAIGILVVMVLTVIAGVTVRLTGSGLGCDDWPNCSSTRVIDVTSSHARIEQLNRLFTLLTALAAIAGVVGSWRLAIKRTDLVAWSVVLLLSVIANAVLGGVSVLIDLHPIAIQFHLILALIAVAAATVMVRRSEFDSAATPTPVGAPWTKPAVWTQYTLTWVAIATGTVVTGAGPHAGDPSAPRLGIDIETAARVHSLTVLVTITAAMTIAFGLRRGSGRSPGIDRIRADLSGWIVLGILQAVIGYVQYFSGVPALLVGLHVLGATLVIWLGTRLVLDTVWWRVDSNKDSMSNLELAITDGLE